LNVDAKKHKLKKLFGAILSCFADIMEASNLKTVASNRFPYVRYDG